MNIILEKRRHVVALLSKWVALSFQHRGWRNLITRYDRSQPESQVEVPGEREHGKLINEGLLGRSLAVVCVVDGDVFQDAPQATTDIHELRFERPEDLGDWRTGFQIQ